MAANVGVSGHGALTGASRDWRLLQPAATIVRDRGGAVAYGGAMPDAAKQYDMIRLEVDGPVATIVLDRPDRLNAFTVQMLEEMLDALDRTDADDAVRAVVVTGAGRAFCAGADLEPAEGTFARPEGVPFSMATAADEGGILARRFLASAKPLIAAINGPAVGIGLSMTLSMDFRLVVATAKLGFVFAKRGIVPEACSTFLLPRLVGQSQAAEWCFTGRIFGPEEALAGGLVRSVHDAGGLLPAAHALAAEIADGTSAVSVAMTRRMLWHQLGAAGDPVHAHEVESEALHFLGSSPEAAEGVMAFLERRPVDFPLKASEDLPGFYRRW
jgi:enoyl-CoA hydratase/carnithine racemase